MSKELKISLILITIMVLAFFASQELVKDVVKFPLNIPISTKLNSNATKEFNIKYPGNYSLQLLLHKVDNKSFNEIRDIIGDGGFNIKSGEPTGKFKKYAIAWNIRSSHIELSGTGSHLTRGAGYSKNNISKLIGEVSLPKGNMILSTKFKTDLSELSKYNPRLILTPGAFGAKTTQSKLTGYIWMFNIIMWALLPITSIILILRWSYLYVKSYNKSHHRDARFTRAPVLKR